MQCPSCHVAVEGGPPFCPSCGAPLPREAGPDPLLGRVFQGKYTIVKLLGEGGMGAVYVGEQALGAHTRNVAIKTLHAHLSRDEKIRERFQREVGTLATLEHPNTVQVFDFGTSTDGVLYIVMEFVQGRSIGDHLEKEGPMSATRVEKHPRADLRLARGGARQGDRPPRSQAREHHPDGARRARRTS